MLVDTEEHRAALPGRHRRRAVVVPVGAPAAWFAAAPRPRAGAGRADPGPLRVVFYGLYTPLQGTPVIGAALSLLAGTPIEVTMIGHGQDAAAARRPPRPTRRSAGWTGCLRGPARPGREPRRLPRDLRHRGQGRRVVPNKVFQGAAAGCAIVTSDTAPQRRTLGGAAVLVPPGDPGALAGALRELAGDPAALARLRGAARELAAGRFAPAQVVAPLLRILGPAPAPAGPGKRPGLEAPLTPNAWLRYDVVTRMLPAGVRDVLEIGCGQGALGVRLAQRYDYLGLEPDQASYAVAERRIKAAGRGEVRNIRVAALGPEQFDLVCAFEVLEHIEDDAAAVRQWAARLRPGGWLLLSVPAAPAPVRARPTSWSAISAATIPRPWPRCWPAAGFTDIEVRQYGFPLGYALEAGRNLIGRRRLAAAPAGSVAERTAASGRLLQPASRTRDTATRYGTAPFRLLQRGFPGTGTGLVAAARLAG